MRRHIANTVILVVSSSIIFGCLTRPDIIKSDFLPAPAVTRAVPHPGAIWSGENGRNMLFSDKKARYLNDIVTIVVSESASGTNTATTNTSRTGSSSAGITSLLGLDRQIIEANQSLKPRIEIGGSATSTLKGTGSTVRRGTLDARVTARVVQVLDNGNLIIEGRRQVRINEENQYLIISGMIRPEDITADNLIASQHIADARIIYTGEGVINDKMRPGWLTRVVDWVWPF